MLEWNSSFGWIIFFSSSADVVFIFLVFEYFKFWEDGFARILPVAENFVVRNDIILHVRFTTCHCQTGIHICFTVYAQA